MRKYWIDYLIHDEWTEREYSASGLSRWIRLFTRQYVRQGNPHYDPFVMKIHDEK